MNWLTLVGKVDGWLMAAAATWGSVDPNHREIALLVGGIAGGLGGILNAVAFFLKQPAPVGQVESK